MVIGDLGEGWSYSALNRALRLLMSDPAIPLVALGMTRYWRAEDGLRLDAGAFVRALEYAAGRTAVVVGKPDRTFYGAAVEALHLPADQVVMIGDDIHTDIEGAQLAGLTGVLVRTGKFHASDLHGGVGPTRCSTPWLTCHDGGPNSDRSRSLGWASWKTASAPSVPMQNAQHDDPLG